MRKYLQNLSPILALTFSFSAGAVPLETSQIAIAGPSQIATDIGEQVALAGGNVVDTAVATALALSVTSPYYAAFGGGGFAVVAIDKKLEVLDFREVAPKKMGPDSYKALEKEASRLGGAAIGVPGIPEGLYQLHKKYGKLPWKKLFAEPIKLAEDGFRVSGEWVEMTTEAEAQMNAEGKKHFTVKDKVPKPGEILKQPGLAKALKLFRDQGRKGFYEGDVAKDIASTVQKQKGLMTVEDLKNYKSQWREPLKIKFLGYDVALMPPPSSGGIVIAQALRLFEKLNLNKLEPLSVDELHLIGETLSRTFRGRNLLADPGFHENPLKELQSDAYLDRLTKSINIKKHTTIAPLDMKALKESSQTTHFSVLDKDGNSVAMTITLNGNYGSKMVSEKYGVALNNEMDDFTTILGEPNMFGLVQGAANKVEAGKRPLSSMSPTLVLKDGKVVLSVGSPGGPRIISAVLQVLYRSLVNDFDVDWAIQAPRVHHQYIPDALFVDKNRLSPIVIEKLKERGHKVNTDSHIAKVYAVKLRKDGILEAAYDSRGEGGASGY